MPLGLLDYGNPVFYTVTMVTILKNMYGVMDRPFNVILLMGAIISIFFGLVIPTGKVIVGLGLIEFKMPVSLVACVNTGTFDHFAAGGCRSVSDLYQEQKIQHRRRNDRRYRIYASVRIADNPVH